MKKLIYTALFTFSLLLFPYPVSAFTDNFNVTIDEELITIAGKPGNTYTTTINIETMNTTQTVHLFGISLPAADSYSASSWITPAQTTANITNQTPTTLTFTLTIPSSATAGEYYQALAVSDKPFSDTEDSDPTTLVAVPVIIQVSSDATESTTTTTSSSTSTTSTSTTSTSATAQTTTTKTITTKPITKNPSPTKTAPPITTPTLFSKLNIVTFTPSLSLWNLQTIFELILKNEGNIYSSPTGSIQVLNLKNNVLQNIPLNVDQKNLLPQKQNTYKHIYKGKFYTIGLFKAKLNLISTDTQNQNPISTTKQVYFFHISLLPLLLILVTILFALSKTKNKKTYITICFLILTLLAFISQQSSPKFLSDTQNLNITAEVKTQIGLKSIINNDLSKTILFTSTNPLGSSLFSLQNGTRTSLDDISQYSYGSFTTNLSYPQDSHPLMMITTGY